jgi:hypothetical protein
MNPLIQLKQTNLLSLALLVLLSFALSPAAQAQLPSPSPDGGYPGENTAEGDGALFSVTSGVNNTAIGNTALNNNTTGSDNTATGGEALLSNTMGNANTATGSSALASNINGSGNTAIGFDALLVNVTGNFNTASGEGALQNNTTDDNTATGSFALFSNTFGFFNTATGSDALFSNTEGSNNTAIGDFALVSNTFGGANTATGSSALVSNTTGSNNTATGVNALFANTGTNNIALGFDAGTFLTTGNNNIDIGSFGVAAEANTIRIGTVGTQTRTFIAGINVSGVTGAVVKVNSNGRLGVAPSSARFKDEIKPMDKASEAILSLKPVTFRYKQEIDSERTPQFGLVAEDVAKVNPDLVVRDAEGKVYTVRYDAVNTMLLNEFLKEHRKVQELEANDVQQQNAIKALTAMVKEQASQIQKVSTRLELSQAAPQTVLNNH